MDMPINFAVDTDFSEFEELADQGLLNAYVKPPSKDGAAQAEIRVTPGQRMRITNNSYGSRGMIVMNGDLYAFFTDKTLKVEPDGTTTELARVPGTGELVMAFNARRIPQLGIITASGKYFILEDDILTAGPQYLDDAGDPAVWNSITYIDGFAILSDDNGLMVATGINQMKEISGLDTAFAAGKPDGLRGVIAVNLDLWALGHKTIEIWRTNPNAAIGFPLTRLSGGVVPQGCLTYASAVDVDGRLLWIGEDRKVYQSEGYRGQPVSNRAVERAIESLTDEQLLGLRSYTYPMAGNEFYGLISDDWTWELNVSTGLWAQRSSHNMNRWRGQHCVSWQNRIYCAAKNSGNIYELDPAYRVEDQHGPVPFEMRSAPLGPFNGTAPMSNLRIRLAMGRAIDYIEEPEAMLDYTDDGGRTWSPTRYVSLKKLGERGRQIKINRLGAVREDRSRTWRLRITADHVVGVVSAQVSAQ